MVAQRSTPIRDSTTISAAVVDDAGSSPRNTSTSEPNDRKDTDSVAHQVSSLARLDAATAGRLLSAVTSTNSNTIGLGITFGNEHSTTISSKSVDAGSTHESKSKPLSTEAKPASPPAGAEPATKVAKLPENASILSQSPVIKQERKDEQSLLPKQFRSRHLGNDSEAEKRERAARLWQVKKGKIDQEVERAMTSNGVAQNNTNNPRQLLIKQEDDCQRSQKIHKNPGTKSVSFDTSCPGGLVNKVRNLLGPYTRLHASCPAVRPLQIIHDSLDSAYLTATSLSKALNDAQELLKVLASRKAVTLDKLEATAKTFQSVGMESFIYEARAKVQETEADVHKLGEWMVECLSLTNEL
ncbi:hypothetical protein QM012_005408 [Aureobasidium pullulans]|uniref:Uncharacterized protein n=1 Tax=Aureobasidium pullulans TaxID=5580 RepID=A0ABR0T697_AURPU